MQGQGRRFSEETSSSRVLQRIKNERFIESGEQIRILSGAPFDTWTLLPQIIGMKMSRYFLKQNLSWEQAPVRGGTVMDKSVVWEGDYNMRSAFFRLPAGMNIPEHTHPKWVQVMVLEGAMEIETDEDGKVQVEAGGCYFVESGDTHVETAIKDSLVLVTQAEDRPEFLGN